MAPVVGAHIVDVTFKEKRILVHLDDGRALAAPLTSVGPTVAAMSAAERAGWILTDSGHGVNWPAAGQTSEGDALSVWSIEQDALFEEALAELESAEWKPDALAPRSRALIALWRLVADGYNGGLLQFLGNWGIAEVQTARAALSECGAHRTNTALQEFWDLIRPITESEDVSTIDDVYRAVAGELAPRVDEIDEGFWDAAEELTLRVPLTYGPARSALESPAAESPAVGHDE
ncbi:DMP19 family protein [Microbacterium galbinum]|uniref:DUF4375 domain-containing protein n=1 Tax=Microbacterium galbinum TaxID=2851646 RepID=A0ABY4IUK7_9MICO|nr:DUF4375 domain-containing protein [Microbacterium galbinum]UPL15476.1 DUF4375 domain-containing protein [Microbacterium galbinum]